ncbi:nuclease domain-containing protein, partial [Shigella flexneri]|uniref:nuclease domain-containing protein n=1 Tax=Shigella flexneri TaxID=623 RepID=UPI000ADFD583
IASSRDGTVIHWLHFDAKYRLQLEQKDDLFESADEFESESSPGEDLEELRRVHRQEDLFKMHTYRVGILGSRGAYVLFPGDRAGGVDRPPKPNFFVRHPSAFGGGSAHRLPSVGAFALSPGGNDRQYEAIRDLFSCALNAVASN